MVSIFLRNTHCPHGLFYSSHQPRYLHPKDCTISTANPWNTIYESSLDEPLQNHHSWQNSVLSLRVTRKGLGHLKKFHCQMTVDTSWELQNKFNKYGTAWMEWPTFKCDILICLQKLLSVVRWNAKNWVLPNLITEYSLSHHSSVLHVALIDMW